MKFNIVHLIVSMPIGGVEALVLGILKLHDREKYNVMLCCIRDLGELGHEANRCGIQAIELGLMKNNRFDPRIAWRIFKILKTHNIHILQTHQYVANLYGRIAAIFAKTPVVISCFHNVYTRPKRHRSFFNRLLANKTDFLIAVSNAVAEDILKYDIVKREKVKIIYNGIDPKRFSSLPGREECKKYFGFSKDKIILGNVGRISEAKNHKVILETLSVLKRNDVVALFVGEGDLQGNLQNLSTKLGVAKNSIFLGRLHPDKIPLVLKSMDIFFFPSLWEGFPIALVEAMETGLPIVASDIPPHREAIGDAGILVSMDDKERLVEALETLIENPSLRDSFGRKAKERARLFSIENTVRTFEDLFEETLKGKGFL